MRNIRLYFIAVTVLPLTACSSGPVETRPSVPVISASPAPVEVVHTARYTLIRLAPDEALRYPLRQTASHTLPAPKKGRKDATREDALKIWLDGTGYGLCLPVTDDIRLLYSSPLPDIHRSPGPLRIETALQVIAGPAWTMSVNEITRTVCFMRAHVPQILS